MTVDALRSGWPDEVLYAFSPASKTLPKGDEPEYSVGSPVVSACTICTLSEQSVHEALPPLSAVAGSSSSASLGIPSSGSPSVAPPAVVSGVRA